MYLLLFFSLARSYNLRAGLRGFFFYSLGLIIPILLMLSVLASNISNELIDGMLGVEVRLYIRTYLVRIYSMYSPEFSLGSY